MVFVPGASIEHRRLGFEATSGLQINFAVNARCALTSRCGANCILAHTDPSASHAMSREMVLSAISESFDLGRSVRHFSFVAKEPLESPSELQFALTSYHSRSFSNRPQAIGMVTNGLLIPRNLDWMVETPFSWVLTSLDGMPHTHLRGADLFWPALENLLLLRERGGSQLIGVNSVFDGKDEASLIELGNLLSKNHVDSWNIGARLLPEEGKLRPVVQLDSMLSLLDKLIEDVSADEMQILLDLTDAEFWNITGHFGGDVQVKERWRLEFPIPGTNIRICTINPRPGWFLRIRHDGAIMQKHECFMNHAPEPMLGYYSPGRLQELATTPPHLWANTQEEDACIPIRLAG